MKRILVVTGTRAEYGLLRNLMLKFQSDLQADLHIAATVTHLSKKHGMTVETIRADGFRNIHEVNLEIEGDSAIDLCDGIANGLSGFSRLLSTIEPDLMVLLGDRYELWSAAISAVIANIPMAHIHGGESTEGAIDEAVRHSLTKMAHLHFCSHEKYKERILRMGEDPTHVWNVGAIGLDRIVEMKFLSRNEIEKRLQLKMGDVNILCTFHPVTLDENRSAQEMQELVGAIEDVLATGDVKVFISLPNADIFSDPIRTSWDALIKKHPTNVFGYVNLGDHLYISLMKEVDVVLGNSSSGILEAPFLGRAVVDVGRRQEGRLRSGHVIHSSGDDSCLKDCLRKALSKDFQLMAASEPSIYGDGKAVNAIYQKIMEADLSSLLFKKFNDGGSYR